MSTPMESPPQHPLHCGLDALNAALDTLAEANLWSATDTDTLDALTRLVAAQSRITAALLATVREVDGRGLPTQGGFKNTRGLLRNKHLLDRRPAAHLTTLATDLAAHPATTAALAAGTVSVDHARVIATALKTLPDTTTADQRDQAETDLIDYASQLAPDDLTACAQKIKELLTVAPDVDDPDDAPDPDPAEDFRGIRYGTHRTGLATIHITIDPHTRRLFDAILDPLAKPEPDHDGLTDTRTASQRRADAFATLVHDHRLGAASPAHTSRAAVTVTLDHDTLTGLSRNAGLLDDGTPLPAATLRYLLCGANILPAVLGGASEILDLGRTRRLHTHYQHRALALRDKGCIFGACDTPAHRCHDHHTTPWINGGPTTLTDAALLCPRHHRQVHRENWTVELGPNGHPHTIPPPSIDPTRRPRQHPRFLNVRRH